MSTVAEFFFFSILRSLKHALHRTFSAGLSQIITLC